MAFQLHLRGQTYSLKPGFELTTDTVSSLVAINADRIIAKVTSNPSNPSILGLTNLSTAPWPVIQASMTAKLIEPGKTIRLEHGSKISFGDVVGEIVETGNAQGPKQHHERTLINDAHVLSQPALVETSKSGNTSDGERQYMKYLRDKKAWIIAVGAFSALALLVFSLPNPTTPGSDPDAESSASTETEASSTESQSRSSEAPPLSQEADANTSDSPELANATIPTLAPGGAYVVKVYDLDENNYKRAEGAIRYNNGNTLRGTFDVNCITAAIEPRNFVMTSRDGTLLKSGETWEPPFKTRWPAELKLYSLVCNRS